MRSEITPQELKARLDRREPIVLVDVREGWETALCALPNAIHIPIEEIEVRVDELDPREETVVYCHHGTRSAAVVDYLCQLGFPSVSNLGGGLEEWSRTVDPSMRRY